MASPDEDQMVTVPAHHKGTMAIRNKDEMAEETLRASVSCLLPKTTKTNDKQTLWKLHHLSWVMLLSTGLSSASFR